jgi:hypothetical protein
VTDCKHFAIKIFDTQRLSDMSVSEFEIMFKLRSTDHIATVHEHVSKGTLQKMETIWSGDESE